MGDCARWLKGSRAYALLALLCLALYLPGIVSFPPFDRDEARFAQATRQMLETGDFVRIRFQDEARNNKPVGIYWLQAAAVAAFSRPGSRAMWPYRLPSLFGALAAVLMVLALGRALFPPDAPGAASTGPIAAILLACTVGLIAEAHLAKTDAMLLAAVVAGQGALGLAYVRVAAGERVKLGIAIVFWVAEAAGILLKGPIAPGLALTTAASLSIADHDWRWLRQMRPLGGVVLLVVLVAPWLVAIELATRGSFLAQSLGQDFWAKLVGGQDSHGAPPFYYLLLSVATFWPGSLFLVPALMRGWRWRNAAAERFLLAWIIPAWIFLELVPTKLPHYDLPLFPALALLVGRALAQGLTLEPDWRARIAEIVVAVLWAIVTMVLAAVLIVLPLRFGEGFSGLGLVAAIVLIGFGALLLRQRRRPLAASVLAALLALVFVAAAARIAPGLDRLWLSRSAASLVARHPRPPGTPLVAVGDSEPSLVFLLGTDTSLTTAPAAAQLLEHGGEALVGAREDAMFRQDLAARGLHARSLGHVAGFDYSNGQHIVLRLYDVTPG
jgi:4-amino-4-deoxy-L-arabinose transferase-like glycosyltransferase